MLKYTMQFSRNDLSDLLTNDLFKDLFLDKLFASKPIRKPITLEAIAKRVAAKHLPTNSKIAAIKELRSISSEKCYRHLLNESNSYIATGETTYNQMGLAAAKTMIEKFWPMVIY